MPDKSFDVEKPGKTAPSASTRPIIINSGPMVKDSTITAVSSTDPLLDSSDSLPKKSPPSRTGLTLSPSKSISRPTDEVSPETVDEEATKSATPAPTENLNSDLTNQEIDNKETSKSPENNSEETTAPADSKKTSAQNNEEEKKKAEAVEKLIQEKKYFINLGDTRKSKPARNLLIIVIILAVTLLAVDLLVDSGLIKTQLFIPPVDLIKN